MQNVADELSQVGHDKLGVFAIIIRERKILLGLRHYTPETWKDITAWVPPGGRCDDNETIEQTLQREVGEEIGVTDLEIEDYIGETSGAKDGDTVRFFLCSTEQEPQLMEPEKFSEWRWVDVDAYLSDPSWGSVNPVSHEFICEYLRTRQL